MGVKHVTLVKSHFKFGGHVFVAILSKINRVPQISNIADCTKFGDNRRNQCGIRTHTSFKLGVPLDPKMNIANLNLMCLIVYVLDISISICIKVVLCVFVFTLLVFKI